MPLYSNSYSKVVTYGTGEFISQILDNDHSVASSTTYESAFKVSLGPSERILFRAFLYFDYHQDGDIKYKIVTPTGSNRFLAILRQSELPIHEDIAETVTQYVGSGGTGDVSPTPGNTGQHFAWIQYGLVETPGSYAADASRLFDIQFAQQSSSANATTLKRGSYIEYKKF